MTTNPPKAARALSASLSKLRFNFFFSLSKAFLRSARSRSWFLDGLHLHVTGLHLQNVTFRRLFCERPVRHKFFELPHTAFTAHIECRLASFQILDTYRKCDRTLHARMPGERIMRCRILPTSVLCGGSAQFVRENAGHFFALSTSLKISPWHKITK